MTVETATPILTAAEAIAGQKLDVPPDDELEAIAVWMRMYRTQACAPDGTH